MHVLTDAAVDQRQRDDVIGVAARDEQAIVGSLREPGDGLHGQPVQRGLEVGHRRPVLEAHGVPRFIRVRKLVRQRQVFAQDAELPAVVICTAAFVPQVDRARSLADPELHVTLRRL